jgi:DNA repair exonuclease SbcCD ATPase subunit
LKKAVSNSEGAGSTNDALSRKVELLEEELDASEKNLKETVEKYDFPPAFSPNVNHTFPRLRQVDIKAEQLERQVQHLEQEKDMVEKKYEVHPGSVPSPPLCAHSSIRQRQRNIRRPRPILMSLLFLWKVFNHRSPCLHSWTCFSTSNPFPFISL